MFVNINNTAVYTDGGKKSRSRDGEVIGVKAGDFSAEAFVTQLLTEGENAACDETVESFHRGVQLPPYYDKKLFKRGQNFFFKHIFSLLLCKFLGLILLMAFPALEILIMTNMSDTPLKAYRRYLATVFHVCVWYSEDLEPGSKLWNSLEKVKGMHNSASRRSKTALKYRINQKDMALTQFGFFGFSLVRSKMVGIHDASEEEWKALIHVWRVIGYILGIEDRYNICRESVDETRAICNVLIDREFSQVISRTGEDFEKMSRALIDGMWSMNPVLDHDTFIYYLHMILENSEDINKLRAGRQITGWPRLRLRMIIFATRALQCTLVRVFFKYLQICTIWFMTTLPLLAYYQFGKENSHVRVDGF